MRFLEELGRALQGYSIPSHRVEGALANAARRLGVRAEFLSTPTSLISAFGEPGDQHVALARVQPGALELDKLVDLDDTVEALYRGDLTVDRAQAELHGIVGRPARYPAWAHVGAFALAAAAASHFFGGGWADMGAAGLLGLAGGLLGLAAGRWEAVGRMHEFLVTLVATVGAAALARVAGPLSPTAVVIGSIIVLLPGLMLTLALNELGTGHVVAGTARLSASLMVFLQIGLGVGLGGRLAAALPGVPVAGAAAPVPPGLLWLLIVLTALALGVLFRAHPREMPAIAAAAVLAYWSARTGVALLGTGPGTVMGALTVGLAGNLYARLRHRPAVVVIVPSLILLVPGSIGYRSLSFLLEKDVLSGVDNAFTALLVGVGLVAGLLLANVLVPPRNAL